jgi:predicted nucleic acid-binding protein
LIPLPRCVLDASIALKWHLDDEEYSIEALLVLTDYQEGRVDLIAPANTPYEVPGAIKAAVSRRRLSAPDGRAAIESFLALRVQTVENNSLTLHAYDLALQHNCSYYDGLYLALSAATGTPLLFADERLRRAIEDRFQDSVFIANYAR